MPHKGHLGCLKPPTFYKKMHTDAATEGQYSAPGHGENLYKSRRGGESSK